MPKLAVILVGNRIKQVRIWNFPIYNALKERGPAVSKLAYFLLSGRENLECYGKYLTGSVRVFIREFNYYTLQFVKELRGFLVRQKNTNSGIFQYAFTMLCFGARLCFCRRVFLYPVLENASVTVPAAVPHPLISILPVN